MISRRAAARPWAALAILVALALTLMAGCSSGSAVDKVTVSAGAASVTLPPALSCITPSGGSKLTCAGGENDDNAPHLAVAPGTPLDVSVPTSVGDTPWVIVFSYLTSDGTAQGDRTEVFAPKERYSYHLEPPAGAQLTRLEVQSLTAAPIQGGGVEFPATGTWVLVIDPVGGGPTSAGDEGAQEP